MLNDPGLAPVRDETAGLEVILPMAVVAFGKYEYPLAHHAQSGDIAGAVLPIGHAGDQATLSGLYDIMQTLDIAPLDGCAVSDGLNPRFQVV